MFKPRTEQRYHKVRSGCTTCKYVLILLGILIASHPNVKTESVESNATKASQTVEGKATSVTAQVGFDSHNLNRCLTRGHECLYNVPRRRILGGVYSKRAAHPLNSIKQCAGVQSSGTSDGNSDSQPSPTSKSPSVRQSPGLARQVNLSFGTRPEERRSLHFWLYETGPTLSNYGPDYGFWIMLLPQAAWRSPVCRHLLVATALVDEQLGLYRKATTSKLTPQAIWHYHAAIKKMANAQAPDVLCLTLASLIAWVFETMQSNYSAAKIHIRAASRLLRELESSSSGLDWISLDTLAHIKPVLHLSEAYSHAIFSPDPQDESLPPDVVNAARAKADKIHLHSLVEARDLLLDRIALFRLSIDRTGHAALAQRLYIRSWHKSVRQYCSQGSESNLHKKAVQVLFNVGMALLPESEAGAFSYAANPVAAKHILDALERIMSEKIKARQIDDRDIELTLSLALKVVMCNIRDEPHHGRAGQLLSML